MGDARVGANPGRIRGDGLWPIRTERENRQRCSRPPHRIPIWIGAGSAPPPPARAGTGGCWRRCATNSQPAARFWDARNPRPGLRLAATGPALEAYSRHPVVKITDSPGRQLTVAEFLRHVRRMVVGFVVSRLLSPDGGATDELDDVTTYYLLHRNDFGLEPASGGACILYACPATSPIRTLAGRLDSWLAAASAGPRGTTRQSDEGGAHGGRGGDVRLKRGTNVRQEPGEREVRRPPVIDCLHKLIAALEVGDPRQVDRTWSGGLDATSCSPASAGRAGAGGGAPRSVRFWSRFRITCARRPLVRPGSVRCLSMDARNGGTDAHFGTPETRGRRNLASPDRCQTDSENRPIRRKNVVFR